MAGNLGSETLSTSPRHFEQKNKLPTRQATHLFGLGPAITGDDETITGTRLPTCLQVLRCMMYHCDVAAHTERPGLVGAPSRFVTAKLVLLQVTTFYEKGNIPMVSERRACDKIVKLLDDVNKVRYIDKSRKDTPATQQKLEDLQRMLATTFQLWPADVEKLIKNPQDLAFLHSMQEDRVASFGVFDRTLAQKIYRRNSREAAEAERLERARNDMKASSSSIGKVCQRKL